MREFSEEEGAFIRFDGGGAEEEIEDDPTHDGKRGAMDKTVLPCGEHPATSRSLGPNFLLDFRLSKITTPW